MKTNPFHKPDGTHKPEIVVPISALTPQERIKLMFRNLDVVNECTRDHRRLTEDEVDFNKEYLDNIFDR